MTTTGTRTDETSRSRYAQSSAGSSSSRPSPATPAPIAYAHRRERVVLKCPLDPALAVAHADHRQVDGEEDGREPRLERLRDQLIGHAVVAEHVDLEEADAARAQPPRPRRAGGREGREAKRRPGGGGRPRHPLLPVRVRQPLVGDRCHDDRRADRVAEHGRRRRDGVDSAQNALAQPPRAESRRRSRRVFAPRRPHRAKNAAQCGSMRASASPSTSVSVSGVSTARA